MNQSRDFWAMSIPKNAVEHLTPEQRKELARELHEKIEYSATFEAILAKYELEY